MMLLKVGGLSDGLEVNMVRGLWWQWWLKLAKVDGSGRQKGAP
jgi:hypothetical protein